MRRVLFLPTGRLQLPDLRMQIIGIQNAASAKRRGGYFSNSVCEWGQQHAGECPEFMASPTEREGWQWNGSQPLGGIDAGFGKLTVTRDAAGD